MAAWVVKKHLGKMFCTPFIPLDGNYVKGLNACELFSQKPVKNPAVCSVRLSERTSAFRAEKNGSTPLPSTTSPKYKGTNMQVMLRQVNMQVN